MKKSSARSAKKTKPAAKSAAKRRPQKSAKKSSPKKAAKRAPAKKAPQTNAASESTNPLSRVARVAKEIAHQTTVAVTEGVDKVKEVSGSIVERVTG
jgi:hypothetical protein